MQTKKRTNVNFLSKKKAPRNDLVKYLDTFVLFISINNNSICCYLQILRHQIQPIWTTSLKHNLLLNNLNLFCILVLQQLITFLIDQLVVWFIT